MSDLIEISLFYKHEPEDKEIFTEKVLAEKHGDNYKLVSIPAFAPNLAYGDVVSVFVENNEYHFDDIIEESGYSTLHIVLFNKDLKEQVSNTLMALGCDVIDHIANNYLVVSIKPEAPYHLIHDFLLSEEGDDKFSFRESCLSEKHRV